MNIWRRASGLVFFALALAPCLVVAQGAAPAPQSASMPQRDMRFLIIHSPGPRWDSSKGMFEQVGLSGHIAHYRKLQAEGKLLLGGPFMDAKGGGMMLPEAGLSEKELTDFAMDDPAVKDGLLTVQVRPWLIGMRK